MVFSHKRPLGLGRWLVGLLLVFVTSLALPVWAQYQAIPKLDNWLVDTTGTFNPAQKQALSDRLKAFEENKGAQIFVLVVPTTGNEVIEQYARRVYDQWKIGREKIDDGILLVVAKDDRRLRIEVGYGLEGAVTDLQAGRIIREFIAPSFVQGDYVGGINHGVDKIMGLVEGEDLPPPVKGSAGDSDEESPWAMVFPLAFFSLVLPPVAAVLAIGLFTFLMFWSLPLAIVGGVVALFLSLLGRKVRASDKGNSARASSRGAAIGGLSGGFGSGGGFGGGGFGGGGFGGGGGGSSGGGGASGGW